MSKKSIPDKASKKILSYSIADKKVLWLSAHNKYLVVIPPVDEIIQMLYLGNNDLQIIDYCKSNLQFDSEESTQIIAQLTNNLGKELKNQSVQKSTYSFHVENLPQKFTCNHFYKINEIIFFIEYETAELEYYIHPKFAHLETLNTEEFNYHFHWFNFGNQLWLLVDGKILGSWKPEMEHFMSGKVSLEILQKITQTEEKDWMAVFHAAGFSYNDEGILFLGDSGNGKSTLSAILMANGFNVLADDFLPVLSKSSLLCSFPAAISVKKHAIDMLANQFPDLKHAKEYEYPVFNKMVRYLSNPFSYSGDPKKVKCKALVFIKYEAGSKLEVCCLAKDIAFQKLVPDSWISPLEINAKQFLEWFHKLPCWQLTYSDNQAMVETVKKIFADEL